MKNLKRFLKRKYIIWAVALVAVIAIGMMLFGGGKAQEAPFVVHSGEFLNQISVSGKIEASENIDLSFEQPGIVRGVYVKVGDKVNAGKLIASQDTAQLYAQSLQMQAGIDLQKAKLNQLLAGSSSEDIKIKEDAVISAKQDVADAYGSALASLNSGYNAIYNASTVAIFIKNTYFLFTSQQDIRVQNAKNEIADNLADAKTHLESAQSNQDMVESAVIKMSADLTDTYNQLKIIREQCDQDVYYSRVSASDKASLDAERASVNSALAGVVSSKQSITSYKTALQQAQNQFEAIKAGPRTTDTAVYEAQIRQAEGSLQEISAQIRKKQIIAPIKGIITAVNAKTGSIFGSSEVAVSIIGDGKFQIESYVPEIYISSVTIGNEARVTLDAYGTDKKFEAKVVFIDPSQTQKDGVSTYKTTLQFINDDKDLKDGMSANVVIITNKKQNVISVPQGLVKIKGDKKIVNVKQGEEIVEKEVQTGDVSSSGQVEIITGLREGDLVVE